MLGMHQQIPLRHAKNNKGNSIGKTVEGPEGPQMMDGAKEAQERHHEAPAFLAFLQPSGSGSDPTEHVLDGPVQFHQGCDRRSDDWCISGSSRGFKGPTSISRRRSNEGILNFGTRRPIPERGRPISSPF